MSVIRAEPAAPCYPPTETCTEIQNVFQADLQEDPVGSVGLRALWRTFRDHLLIGTSCGYFWLGQNHKAAAVGGQCGGLVRVSPPADRVLGLVFVPCLLPYLRVLLPHSADDSSYKLQIV